MKLKEAYKICKKIDVSFNQHPKICIMILMAAVVSLLIIIPPIQVSFWGIDNATINADLDNKFRITLAQIVGGAAVFITLYYTGENLKIAKEGQMGERFTRAIDQLADTKKEIRLGAIYTLESILDRYEETYWPIMEILTTFVREKASTETKNMEDEDTNNLNKISLDVQAALTVIGKRKHPEFEVYNSLDLHSTYLLKAHLKKANFKGANFEEANLEEANLKEANLERANLRHANLKGADFPKAHLEWADFFEAHLEKADFFEAHLEKADFSGANLEEAELFGAHLEKAYLKEANLKEANLKEANLEAAYLEGANLMGAKNLTINQLSKVKTLYKSELDKDLRIQLEEKYSVLFDKPDDLRSLSDRIN